ncbi:MAG: hypothetical protein DMG13_13985 [Acidobacteria bacterium]|nr:MAG: hypothetical protein DMG13_13985 [Acidobacteriota bacterium]
MSRKVISSLILVLFLSIVFARAQNITATLVGTLKDETGAVLPGVDINIVHIRTNRSYQVLSDEAGAYRLPLLPPGEYSITAQLAGFRTEVRSGIVLQVDQVARVDLTLSVGTTTDRIVVTADAPLVSSETATVGNVIDSRKVVDLPLNGREFQQLVVLVPGGAPPVAGSNNVFRGGFNVAGSHEAFNSFTLDGVDNQSAAVQINAFRPSVDMIQEFKVAYNTFGAEYGRATGAIVSVVTKSGTNEFHGNVFGFLRNSALDARNFFDSKNEPKRPFRRGQFGGTLGGPIAKDRTFFFASYEGLRLFQALTSAATTLPLNWRTGDFSDLATPIRDPLTGQAFPENRIPVSRLNQKGAGLAAYWPKPNRAEPVRNFIGEGRTKADENQFSGRIDHQLSDTHKLLGRISYNSKEQFNPFRGESGTSGLPGFGHLWPSTAANVAIVFTSTLRPNLVNELRAGYTRWRERRVPEGLETHGDVATKLAIPGLSRDPRYFGVPTLNVTGVDAIGDYNNKDRRDNLFQYIESLIWNAGRHSVKMGGDYRRVQENNYIGATRESLTFDGRYSGHAVADLLLGYPTQTSRVIENSPIMYIRSPSFSMYLQDDWKATDRLTLNLGIRWEPVYPNYERRNTFSWFDASTGTVKVAGRDGNPRTPHKKDFNNWAPRFGFAWTPTGKTSTALRGGAGVYYNAEELTKTQASANGVPFNFPQSFIASTARPDISLDDPFAATSLVNAISNLSNRVTDWRSGYVYNWSLGLQQEVLRDVVLDVSYAGSKSTKLTTTRNINQPVLGAGPVASRRPYPQWGNITTLESNGTATYNALLMRVEKRFSKGLSFLSSYTWGHAIEIGTDRGSDAVDAGPQDSYNLRVEKGNTEFDIRHRYTLSYVYQLPWGKGRPFFNSGNSVLQALFGEWDFSGIAAFQSGRYFTPRLAADNSSTAQRRDRPNLIGDWRLPHPDPAQWINPAAFQVVRGQYGNAGHNILYGPGSANFDMSLMKNVPLSERGNIQFRAELFNIFNHPNFYIPDRTVDSAQFGKVFTAYASRQIQFGLKVSY